MEMKYSDYNINRYFVDNYFIGWFWQWFFSHDLLKSDVLKLRSSVQKFVSNFIISFEYNFF